MPAAQTASTKTTFPDLRAAPLASIKLTEPQIRALAGLMETREHGPEGGWSGRGASAMAGALDRRGLVATLEPQDEGDVLEVAIERRGLEWLRTNTALLTPAERKRLAQVKVD